MPHRPLLFIFLLVTILNLWSGYTQNELLAFFTKPCLMPLLGLWFYFETKSNPSFFRNLILGALFFSWGGDLLLMFVESHGEHFFLLGLLSFLITHILYAYAFSKVVPLKKGFLQQQKWIIIPFIIIHVAFNSYLIPDVDPTMQIPVLVYSSVIILMVIAALNWNTFTSTLTFQLVLTGAVAFMLSDMIIALNKFKNPIINASVWIMLLYLFGQYRIIKGSSILSKTN